MSMSKSISILDKDYAQWVEDLSVRYRQSQIRASVKVNRELLRYYWELGRDIEEMHVEERWGRALSRTFLLICSRGILMQQGFHEQTYIMRRSFIFFILSILIISHRLWDNLKQ